MESLMPSISRTMIAVGIVGTLFCHAWAIFHATKTMSKVMAITGYAFIGLVFLGEILLPDTKVNSLTITGIFIALCGWTATVLGMRRNRADDE